jgi:hypothetical protein
MNHGETSWNNARATTTTRTLAVVVALIAISASSAGCAVTSAQLQRPRFAGDLAVAVPVPAQLRDARVEVTITGVDMPSPVLAELDVRDGVARAMLDQVDAGPNRLVLFTAIDRDGRRCAREVNAEVIAGGVAELQGVALECEVGEPVAEQGVASTGPAFPPVL